MLNMYMSIKIQSCFAELDYSLVSRWFYGALIHISSDADTRQETLPCEPSVRTRILLPSKEYEHYKDAILVVLGGSLIQSPY